MSFFSEKKEKENQWHFIWGTEEYFTIKRKTPIDICV